MGNLCANCDRPFTYSAIFPEGFQIGTMNGDGHYDLCSLSCLTEFVWKLRDRQPKLSKSKPFVQPGGACAAGKHFADEGYPCPECAKELNEP